MDMPSTKYVPTCSKELFSAAMDFLKKNDIVTPKQSIKRFNLGSSLTPILRTLDQQSPAVPRYNRKQQFAMRKQGS